jgi:hypothetical protein
MWRLLYLRQLNAAPRTALVRHRGILDVAGRQLRQALHETGDDCEDGCLPWEAISALRPAVAFFAGSCPAPLRPRLADRFRYPLLGRCVSLRVSEDHRKR